jgi:fermentation-respiration switch protein FrsA (DUF1100 family)
VLVALPAIGCGGDDDEESAEKSAQTTGPYAIGTRSLTFVDEARTTPSINQQSELPSRTVVTDIWYPAEGDPSAPVQADAKAADGPFPAIVFNHGQQGEPQLYALPFEMWTRAGYVVIAPRHPVTIRGGPGGQFIHDMKGEAGDVPFVVDRVEDELGDLVDTDRLAVAGHSSGAIVAYGIGFNTCCHDDRFDAVLVQGLLPIPPAAGEFAEDLKGTPVMFQHGTLDGFRIADVRTAFDSMEAPKFFYTLEGGTHSVTFRTGPQAEQTAKAALEFFDFALKERAEALEQLEMTPGVDAVVP